MNDWTNNIRYEAKTRGLRDAVMVCDTFGELHNLISANIDFLVDNPETLEMFERAIRRIRRIRKQQMISWKFELN
jgi:hypothetical protein